MIRRLIRQIKLCFANRNDDSKRKYLIAQGTKIGEQTKLNCKVKAFGTEPYLITVGRNCLFAGDIRLITHDGAVKVLNTLGFFDGERMDNVAPIVIGDNVYIGTGAYVMPGVHIGNNVIIGAYAVVTHDIPDNSVAVGMPARVIKSIEDYYASSLAKNRFYPTVGMSTKEKREYYTNLFEKS